ncbi:hypothetical protein KUCAC02_035217 [Chaenocephalus aceratus]|nr:hypothetical protein KUCAC02_035217 [Chaenocephalus aceratus]
MGVLTADWTGAAVSRPDCFVMPVGEMEGEVNNGRHFSSVMLGFAEHDVCLKRSYTCDVCSVTLNSVAQYHAHLQGSKHQNK